MPTKLTIIVNDTHAVQRATRVIEESARLYLVNHIRELCTKPITDPYITDVFAIARWVYPGSLIKFQAVYFHKSRVDGESDAWEQSAQREYPDNDAPLKPHHALEYFLKQVQQRTLSSVKVYTRFKHNTQSPLNMPTEDVVRFMRLDRLSRLGDGAESLVFSMDPTVLVVRLQDHMYLVQVSTDGYEEVFGSLDECKAGVETMLRSRSPLLSPLVFKTEKYNDFMLDVRRDEWELPARTICAFWERSKQEFIEKTWHPSRLMDWCLPHDEVAELTL